MESVPNWRREAIRKSAATQSDFVATALTRAVLSLHNAHYRFSQTKFNTESTVVQQQYSSVLGRLVVGVSDRDDELHQGHAHVALRVLQKKEYFVLRTQ